MIEKQINREIPLVSVIMSVFNGAVEISQTLESILNQSYPQLEIIIIDDGSTDNSVEILRQFQEKDDRILLLQNLENFGLKGYVNNLNKAIEMSSGKYIAKIDQDDLHDSRRIEKQVAFLESKPDYDLVGTNGWTIDERNEIVGELVFPSSHEALVDYARKKGNPINHPTVVFRKEGFVGYRNKMFYCEDYDLILNLISKKRKFYNLPEKLFKYRITEVSMNRSKDRFINYLFIEVAKRFYWQREKSGFDDYESFKPEFILEIDQDSTKTPEYILNLALRLTLILGDETRFSRLIRKKEKLYGLGIHYRLIKNLNKIFTLRMLKVLNHLIP